MRELTIKVNLDVAQATAGAKGLDAAIDGVTSAAKAATPYLDQVTKYAQRLAGSEVTQQALAMSAAINQIGGAARLTAAEQRMANQVLAEGAEKWRAMGATVPAGVEKQIAALKGLAPAVQSQSTALGALTGMVTRFAGPMAVGFAIKSTAAWADNLEEMSRATGVSIERLQRLEFAARQNGTSFEQLVTMVGQLNNRIGSGDKSAIAALGKLGIAFEDLAKMSPDEQLLAIGDGLSKLKAGAEQVAVGFDLFGRQGQRAMGWLPQLREEMARAPVAFEGAVKQVGSLNDKWNQLIDTGKALLTDVLWPIAAALNYMANPPAPQKTLATPGPEVPGWMYMQGGPKLTAELARIQQGGAPNPRTIAETIAGQIAGEPRFQLRNGRMVDVGAGIGATKAAPVPVIDEKMVEAFNKSVDKTLEAQRIARERQERWLKSPRGLNGMPLGMDEWGNYEFGVSQLTTAPGGVTGYPGLTQWALDQGILGGTDYSGVLWVPPGVAPQPKLEGTKWGEDLFGEGGAFAQLPERLLGAIMGGGNVGRTAFASIGDAVTQYALKKGEMTKLQANIANMAMSLGAALVGGNALASTAGGAMAGAGLGATIGSVVPGIGTAIGAGVGAVAGGITGWLARRKASKEIFPARADYIFQQTGLLEGAGGWQALQQQAAKAGPGAMAAFEIFYKTSDVKQFESALKQLSAALQTAAQKTALVADLESRIAALREQQAEPGWQEMVSLAGKYGIDTKWLGQGVLSGQAGELLSDYQRLLQGGAMAGPLLQGMSPALSKLVQTSLATGTLLPENLRPMVEDAMKAGLLFDEAGKAIKDLAMLTWGPAVQTQQEKLQASIDELTQALQDLNSTLAGTVALGPDSRISTRPGVQSTGGRVVLRSRDGTDLSELALPGSTDGASLGGAASTGGTVQPIEIYVDGQLWARRSLRSQDRVLKLYGV